MEQLFYLPETMLWPALACLVLTGILVYLGVHVIARKVIFVDLALAQIAALGTVTGVLLGYEIGKDLTELYLYSLAFTFLGAFVFSVTRMRGEKVPHEAIIGIVYAVAFAATILVLARSPLGPQELDRIIKGELLWVQSDVVVKTAILYAIIGAFHYIFRKRFIRISFDPDSQEQNGINVRVWDFLFYVSFGFVITSSVAIAGVFLVFSYLVIPAVGAMLLAEKIGTRLVIGWVGAAAVSIIGVKLSWHTGLPTSPLVVCLLAVTLALIGVVRYFRVASNKKRAAVNIAGSTAVFAAFLVGVLLFQKRLEDPFEHALHMLESDLPTERTIAIERISTFEDRKPEWLPLITEKLEDQDAQVRMAAIRKIAELGERSALPQLLPLLGNHSSEVRREATKAIGVMGNPSIASDVLSWANEEEDPELRIELLGVALGLGELNAVPHLIDMLESNSLFAPEAVVVLQRHLQLRASVDEIGKIKKWWRENRDRLQYDPARKNFRRR